MAEQTSKPVVYSFVLDGTVMYLREGEIPSDKVLGIIPQAISDTKDAIKGETDEELKGTYSKGLKYLKGLLKDK